MANEFDVCIIGTGVAGGILAAQLAGLGKRIALVEAGTRHDRAELQRRLMAGGVEPFLYKNEAYTHVPISVDADFRWDVMQNKEIGGNSIYWGAVTPRGLEEEFRTKSADGIAVDWPITYDDLEPYYCRGEEELGVSGGPGDAPDPRRSKPFPLPPFEHSYAGQLFIRACTKLGYGSAPLPFARPSQPYRNRALCCLAGTCMTCPTGAKYSSDVNHVREAVASPNVQLFEQTVAAKLITDPTTHRVTELLCHKPDKSELTIKAGVFVVACNAFENSRLLLISATKDRPTGLGNASGQLGKNLTTHLGRFARLVAAESVQAQRSQSTVFTRHFERGPHRAKHAPFRMEVNAGTGPFDTAQELIKLGQFGSELTRNLRDTVGRSLTLRVVFGMLPRATNRMELDPANADFFGKPGMKVVCHLGDYENDAWAASTAPIEQITEAMNAKVEKPLSEKPAFAAGPHMVGTHRMGNDPKSSVLNADLRVHDVPNLYLPSAGAFPTSVGAAHPTLTLAALTVRLADHLRQKVLL